ncbi:MAG: nucleoside-diphosphate kinase [Parcubacteria group bacterium]|nr:nucleoside-diphosphate kinase [Parcubacteria group bacterium]
MSHPKEEKTLVLIKPDGIQRLLMGEIIQRFERIGLKLVAVKMVVATPEHIEKHYTLDPDWRRVTGEKTIKGYKDKGLTPPTDDPLEVTAVLLETLKSYMTSGPVIAMVWQGAHSAKIVRKLVGGTEPLTSDVGSIRGDFVLDSYQMSDSDKRAVRNLVHASGSPEEADMEIGHWFKDEEIIKYNHIQDKIMYDVNIGGILE